MAHARPQLIALAAVFAGGLLGTAARLGVDALLPHPSTAFPWSTLWVNTLGSFALALLVARVWPVAPLWLKAGLGAGVLGSFTTFSAVAVALVSLADAGAWGLAALFAVASVATGLGAAWAGLAVGRRRETASA